MRHSVNMFRDSIVVNFIEKGIAARESDEPNEIIVCCPFCHKRGKESPDTQYHLGLNTKKNVAHCYRCDWKCGANAVQVLLGVSYQISNLDLAEEKVKTKPIWPKDFEPLRTFGDYWMRKAYSLVQSRGVTPEQIDKFNPGLCLMGAFRYRVVFPLYDSKNKLEGFSGRTIIKDKQPKWYHSKGLEGSLFLAQYHKRDSIVVTEGIWDALAVHRGLKRVADSAALLGHNLSDAKLEHLREYKKIVFWLDPDAAGLEGVIDTAEDLLYDTDVHIISYPKEPGECNDIEVREAWLQKQPWSWMAELRYKANRMCL